jgi:GNAT superfamily N-acetyltransferase
MSGQEVLFAVPEGYVARACRAPLEPGLARSLELLLGHKGEPWLADIRARLTERGLDVFAVAFQAGEPVAHAWLGSSHACPEIGLIGHVYTVETHRRRGLAGALLTALLGQFDEWGGRWAQLGSGNEAAARLYRRFGFRDILVKCRGEPGREHRIMLRGGDADGAGEAYHQTSGRWKVERVERRHGAALCMFLNAVPGSAKLPALGIDAGDEAEHNLLDAYEAQERGEGWGSVLTDAANGRPHGLAWSRGGSVEVYAPRVGPEVRRMLAARASAQDAP